MVFTDPAWNYIESQKAFLLDFIFRLTGDRSRAGIVANEVCEYVHRELLSSWSQQEIRVELFSYAYELNAEAARGIDKAFFEAYYRTQFNDVRRVSVFYPLELFLSGLGARGAFVGALKYRFHFTLEEIARILDLSLEDIESEVAAMNRGLKSNSKVKLEEAVNLPVYDFLQGPDHHPTDISVMVGDIRPKKDLDWYRQPKVGVLFVLLGVIVGFVVYLWWGMGE